MRPLIAPGYARKPVVAKQQILENGSSAGSSFNFMSLFDSCKYLPSSFLPRNCRVLQFYFQPCQTFLLVLIEARLAYSVVQSIKYCFTNFKELK